MSNKFRIKTYTSGDAITARDLNRIEEAGRATPLKRGFGGRIKQTASGQSFTPHADYSDAGGASLIYLEITASTDENTYTATIYDNPVDRNTVEADVTVKAVQHTNGTIPNSTAGKGLFATQLNDIYYLANYTVAY